MFGPSFWAHLAHVIHESLTRCCAELPPPKCESKWTAVWLDNPISFGIHELYDEQGYAVQFQIRIMDQGIMFVAVNHRAQVKERTKMFWFVHQYHSENDDISLKDSTGEYKSSQN